MLKLMILLITYGGGFGGFGVYMSNNNFSSINTILNRHGIQSLKGTQYGWGGLGYGIIGKIWIGGGGFGTTQQVSSDSMDIIVNEGAGFFEIGYMLVETHRFLGAISLGLGGSGVRMTIYPVNREISFDSLLTNPRRDAYVEIGSYISVMPSLNAILRLNRFMGILLRASYIVSPSSSWRFDDGDRVLNVPNFKLSHPVLSLNVTFGGMASAKSK